ncbi:MAG: hypothetical protein ABI643_02535 [Candidatus Doudnabacteria bacterium]
MSAINEPSFGRRQQASYGFDSKKFVMVAAVIVIIVSVCAYFLTRGRSESTPKPAPATQSR